MKTIGILLMGILISCSMSRKQKLNTMESVQSNKIEASFLKNTATWVDGKTYQFIELVINEDRFIEIDLERIYIAGLNEIKIIINSKPIETVFIPIKVNDKYLFLIDDFDDYNKVILSVWCVIHYAVWDRNNLSQDFLSTTVEVNFEEIRNTKLPDIYPEANSAWYKKWKKKNPDFKGERELREERK